MDSRFARLDAVFQAARRLPREARAGYLAHEVPDDPALREEVGAMCAALDEAPDDGPPPVVADLLSSVWPDEAPPETIGEFRVVRRIATGGMSVVYEAEQAHPARRVALKVLQPGAASPEGRRRFAREAEILGRLAHPGIAQVYVVGTARTPAGESPYLAMELVDGEPLTQAARRRSLRQRLALLAEVCDAVAHAHAHRVVHRDLKPSNILVRADGRPKVLDFGVARLLAGDAVAHTRMGQVIGTLAYMSPEQATGDLDRVDPRTDVYALGLLGYEMVCERRALDVGASLPEAVRRIVEDEPMDPALVDRRLHGDVSVMLRKALEKDPSRRYADAAALAADLRRHLLDRPVEARPPTLGYRARKFVRRHRGFVVGTGVTILALSAGLVLALRAARGEERERWRADASAAEARRATSATLLEAAASDLRAGAAPGARRRLARVPHDHRDWGWRHLLAEAETSVAVHPWTHGGPRVSSFGFTAETLGLIDGGGPAIFATREGTRTPALPMEGEVRWSHVAALGGGFAALGREAGAVVWRRLPDGEVVRTDSQAQVSAVAGTRDGARWAYALASSAGFSRIVVADARSGETIFALVGDPVSMLSLAFSADGRRLAAGGYALGIHLIDVETGSLQRELTGHTNVPAALAFHPDGTRLASGGADRVVLVWNLEDGTEVHRFTGHGADVTAVAFDDRGRRVAVGDAGGTIRLWNLDRGACERVLHGHDDPVGAVGFLDERTLVSAAGDGLRTWDVAEGSDPSVLRWHRGRAEGNPHPYVYGVAYSADGGLLASASWDDTVRVMDPESGELLATLPHGSGRVFDVAFSADGRRILAASTPLRLWDADTGRERAVVLHAPRALSSRAAPDGRFLAVTDNHSLRVLDPETLSDVAIFQSKHRSPGVDECAFHPSGRRVATVGRDGRCVVLDVPTGEGVTAFVAHAGATLAVAWSPDGATLATGGDDRAVRLWDAETGRERATLHGHSGKVYALAFHPDGSLLASGSEDGSVRLWDPHRRTERLELRGHADYVHGLAFHPDGETLATASGDGTVRLWSTRSMTDRHRRVAARRTARAEMAGRVAALLERFGDAEAVADALRADATLSALERRAALDLLLMRGSGPR